MTLSSCVSFKKHKAYDVVDFSKFLERKNQALQANLEELGKFIYPLYQEIASSLPVRWLIWIQTLKIDIVNQWAKRNLTQRNRQHASNQNSEILYKKTGSKHVGFIKKQGDEINRTISEITHSFGELKKIKGLK